MPLILESHDSLPYIDGDLSPQIRSSITAVISAELPPDHTTALHPLVPSSYTPSFTPLIQQEHDRIASDPKQPLTAIDLSRYEALEAPPATSPHSDEDRPEILRKWRDALRKAYASSTYLASRQQALALLERYGKNAWLVGNSQLEDILRGIEGELAEVRRQTEEVEGIRRAQQEGARGEMAALEEGWRRGVGKVIEVEVASEALRRDVLNARREGVIGRTSRLREWA